MRSQLAICLGVLPPLPSFGVAASCAAAVSNSCRFTTTWCRLTLESGPALVMKRMVPLIADTGTPIVISRRALSMSLAGWPGETYRSGVPDARSITWRAVMPLPPLNRRSACRMLWRKVARSSAVMGRAWPPSVVKSTRLASHSPRTSRSVRMMFLSAGAFPAASRSLRSVSKRPLASPTCPRTLPSQFAMPTPPPRWARSLRAGRRWTRNRPGA